MSPEPLSAGLLGIGLQAMLLLAVVLGVMVPGVARAERRHAARVEGRGASAHADPGLGGLLEPAARILKLLGKRMPGGSSGSLGVLAPALIAIPPLLAFAAIPFAGRYAVGDGSVSLVLADVEIGVLYVFALAAMGALITVWSAAAGGGSRALVGALRGAARSLSGDLALLFALLPMLLIFGSLRLGEMAAWQDSTFALLALPGALLGGGLQVSGPTWPAWGIFLNPLAFFLVLTAASARAGLAPFDAEYAEAELAGGHSAAYSGLGLGLFALAARLQLLVVAALVVLIFLGGWTLPWISQQTLVEGIGAYLGSGLANVIGLGLHLGAFALKLALVIRLELIIRSALPRLGHAGAMSLCWKIIIPAALVDLALTAAALRSLAGGAA